MTIILLASKKLTALIKKNYQSFFLFVLNLSFHFIDQLMVDKKPNLVCQIFILFCCTPVIENYGAPTIQFRKNKQTKKCPTSISIPPTHSAKLSNSWSSVSSFVDSPSSMHHYLMKPIFLLSFLHLVLKKNFKFFSQSYFVWSTRGWIHPLVGPCLDIVWLPQTLIYTLTWTLTLVLNIETRKRL